MIAWCDKLKVGGVGLKIFYCGADNGVKVVVTLMLWPDRILTRTRIVLALHQAEQVAKDEDPGVALFRLHQQPVQDVSLSVRVVPMHFRQ